MAITINGNGTIDGLTAGGLPDGTVTRDDLATTAKGSILQVKQTHLTTRFSITFTPATTVDITGLNLSITPSSTASKILVFARASFELNQVNSQDIVFNLTRNGTLVGLTSDSVGNRKKGLVGPLMGYWTDDASSTQDFTAYNYLDSPNSLSALTYQVTFESRWGSILHINRCAQDGNSIAFEYLTSSITAMEVAG